MPDKTTSPRLCHPRRSRRRRTRSDHRRAHHADLSDVGLRLQRRRSRRLAVRPRSLRQHLHAHRQPDAGRAGAARGGPRRRHGGPRRRLGPCGAVAGVPHADGAGRRVRRRPAALRRLDQPVQSRLQEIRLDGEMGRRPGSRELRGGDHAQDQGDHDREHRQSRRHRHRHRGDSARSPRSTACR